MKRTLKEMQDFAESKGGKCLSNIFENMNKKLKWQCSEKHVWETRPSHIIYNNTWCPICHKENARKYSCDDDFFSRDTEEAFYVAGFWAADGCVINSKYSYEARLVLARKDLNHLLKIKNILKYNGNIGKRTLKPGKMIKSYGYQNSLIINSKKIFDDLARFNVVERKTYIYDIPEWLKKHPLVHHFMRGYVDGDGCYVLVNNKYISFSMRGTVNMLNSFNNILVLNDIVTRKHSIKPKDGKHKVVFDKLSYGGKYISYKLYKFLYKDATIYLDRKKKIIEKSECFLNI